MHIINFDLKHGSVSVDSTPIVAEEKGVPFESIAKLCTQPIETDDGRTQYRLSRKANVCGKLADGVIEVEAGRVCAVTFLFDMIEFFESSILESKIVKACEKSLNIHLTSNHPSTAFSDSCKWGQVVFFYDAKQGDLSLNITFQHNANRPSSKA